MKYILVAILFILGIIFRLILSKYFPQPYPIYDEFQYLGFAQSMLKEGLHTDTYRLYGYPLIVAPFIHFFGSTDILPLIQFQSVLDAMTGVLVFFLAEKILKNRVISIIAFMLYIFNPFTGAYAGVMLTEVCAIFLLTVILYYLIIYREKMKWWILILLGFDLGYLPQIRPTYIYFDILVLLYLIIFIIRKNFRKKGMFIKPIILAICFFLPFIYNIIGNIMHYKEFNLLSVDDSIVRELYISIFVDRFLPLDKYKIMAVNVKILWNEYAFPVDQAGRKSMAKKYLDLSILEIKNDPWKFIRQRISKMGYIWEKHYFFPYSNPYDDNVVGIIYWSNIVLLVFAGLGLIIYMRSKKYMEYKWFGFLILILIIYTELIHTVSTAEERFTLPLYPYVFIFSTFCVWQIIGKLSKMRMKNGQNTNPNL
jgi:hypothetical protein